mmetsp:Transcript_32347/g.69276  ORF Transcript_32347/g.69276 Transcript_32347/m.69276 type:complete len:226 (-) Transcript_32347:1284-1961(-)
MGGGGVCNVFALRNHLPSPEERQPHCSVAAIHQLRRRPSLLQHLLPPRQLQRGSASSSFVDQAAIVAQVEEHLGWVPLVPSPQLCSSVVPGKEVMVVMPSFPKCADRCQQTDLWADAVCHVVEGELSGAGLTLPMRHRVHKKSDVLHAKPPKGSWDEESIHSFAPEARQQRWQAQGPQRIPQDEDLVVPLDHIAVPIEHSVVIVLRYPEGFRSEEPAEVGVPPAL